MEGSVLIEVSLQFWGRVGSMLGLCGEEVGCMQSYIGPSWALAVGALK